MSLEPATFWGGRARKRGGSGSTFSSRGRGNYGRGSGGRGGGARNGQSQRVRGLFVSGVWHCDCQPQRLPAERFQVKKEGANKGRWFYTCQKETEKRCGFFLWDEDAKPREEAAVLGNSRSEPRPAPVVSKQEPAQEGWSAGRARNGGRVGAAAPITVSDDSETESESPPPPPYSSQRAVKGKSKRPAHVAFDEDEDADFDWPLTGQEADELAQAAEAAAPQTPHKALKTGIYATPATSAKPKRTLPWNDQQQQETPTTPMTGAKSLQQDNYFDTPSKPAPAAAAVSNPAYGSLEPHKDPIIRPRIGALREPITPITHPSAAAAVQPQQQTARTPSPPTRHKDALSNPADSTSSLTSEALAALSSSPTTLPAATLSALRSILTKHDLKTQGITMGRDISRKALRAKDAKIAELQARIASLEAEREVDRGVVRQLRWEAEHGKET